MDSDAHSTNSMLPTLRAIVGDEPSDHDLIHCLQQTREAKAVTLLI